MLASLETDLEGADRAPTVAPSELLEQYRKPLDAALSHWWSLKTTELEGLNESLRKAELVPVGL